MNPRRQARFQADFLPLWDTGKVENTANFCSLKIQLIRLVLCGNPKDEIPPQKKATCYHPLVWSIPSAMKSAGKAL